MAQVDTNWKHGRLFLWCLPSLPNHISPIPISPNCSSYFALCRLAPYPFRPLPFCPFANSLNHFFAQLPFRPFANSSFADSPKCYLALYHFDPSPLRPMPFCPLSSRPFVISSLSFSFTETADYSTRFPGTGAQTVTWYRVRI